MDPTHGRGDLGRTTRSQKAAAKDQEMEGGVEQKQPVLDNQKAPITRLSTGVDGTTSLGSIPSEIQPVFDDTADQKMVEDQGTKSHRMGSHELQKSCKQPTDTYASRAIQSEAHMEPNSQHARDILASNEDQQISMATGAKEAHMSSREAPAARETPEGTYSLSGTHPHTSQGMNPQHTRAILPANQGSSMDQRFSHSQEISEAHVYEPNSKCAHLQTASRYLL
jgi:hypothetical protein